MKQLFKRGFEDVVLLQLHKNICIAYIYVCTVDVGGKCQW